MTHNEQSELLNQLSQLMALLQSLTQKVQNIVPSSGGGPGEEK